MPSNDMKRTRRYPGIDRGTLRPDRKAARRASAAERQAAWDALDVEQRDAAPTEQETK